MKKNIINLIILVIIVLSFSCRQSTRNNKEKIVEKTLFEVAYTEKLENGNLTAMLNGAPFASAKAEKDATIIFTAKADDGYKVDKWEITGGEKVEGGENGSLTAKVKITENVKVSVTFKTLYEQLRFSQLQEYLKNKASDKETNYIEIIELTEDNLKNETKRMLTS
ncbi:MAG: hypothetical protein ACTTKH_07675 [Treponema sp.]